MTRGGGRRLTGTGFATLFTRTVFTETKGEFSLGQPAIYFLRESDANIYIRLQPGKPVRRFNISSPAPRRRDSLEEDTICTVAFTRVDIIYR